MNQCFPGACAGDCMQLNTSNLCFNYDDLLSVGSLAVLSQSESTSQASCIVLYIEFYCLHGGFVCIHQIALSLNCADL